MNRVGHNASMFKMNHGNYDTTPTPDCPACPGVSETIAHMINDCPLYTFPRLGLSFVTHQPTDDRLSQFVLGATITDEDANDKDKQNDLKLTLKLTGQFLLDILRIRKLPII